MHLPTLLRCLGLLVIFQVYVGRLGKPGKEQHLHRVTNHLTVKEMHKPVCLKHTSITLDLLVVEVYSVSLNFVQQ